MRQFLVHDSKDNVGVAVLDLKAGSEASGVTLDGKNHIQIKVRQDIPLGHKIALIKFKPGDTVIKYGEDIGRVVADIEAGDHVHVHNLKTKRW